MSVKLGDVEVAGLGGGSIDAIDDITITNNSDNEIQAVAVVDQNTGIAKIWTGTMSEYDSIVTKDPDTEYIITDDIGGSATAIGQITEALNNKVDKGHEVIEFQAPTAQNNYTWYRKYADGWVEQGGFDLSINMSSSGASNLVTLQIEMDSTNYALLLTFSGSFGGRSVAHVPESSTTTQVCIGGYATATGTSRVNWQVSGMAA